MQSTLKYNPIISIPFFPFAGPVNYPAHTFAPLTLKAVPEWCNYSCMQLHEMIFSAFFTRTLTFYSLYFSVIGCKLCSVREKKNAYNVMDQGKDAYEFVLSLSKHLHEKENAFNANVKF